MTIQRCRRILQWFSDRWPTDLPWPPDVPRPPSHMPSDRRGAGEADGAPGEGAASGRGESSTSLEAWCRQHGFDPRQARKVIELYADDGPRAGQAPRRDSARVSRGKKFRFTSERHMIWGQFVAERDPRFSQAVVLHDLGRQFGPKVSA